MFSYYGSKSKIVSLYPAPKFGTVVEPFAGSARYALMYHDRDVTLFETYEKPYKVWCYLIQATEKDILALPDLTLGESINDYTLLSQEEKWLIGYQLQRGCARPGTIVNARCNWNKDKLKIASLVPLVKHWKIHNQNCLDVVWDENTTYFVDPPYQVQKHGYNHKSVEYERLKEKMYATKNSQFVVCGNEGDNWIPLQDLSSMRGIGKTHMEKYAEILT